MPETDELTLARQQFLSFNKEIAGSYVKPLLEENILKVTKDHITIMSLVIPRERVVFFHIALTQLRSPSALFPIRQGVSGFAVEKVQASRGNDIVDAYRITSNAEDRGSIILTKKLAWELWEVVAFFIPALDGPSDNPLPKTPAHPFQDMSEPPNSGQQEPVDEEEDGFEDYDDEEEDGPITFDYTPFPAPVSPELFARVLDVNDKYASVHNNGEQGLKLVSNDGDVFVIASSNESEHAEWVEGSEWGEWLMETMIPSLNEFSVETYNDLDKNLDWEFQGEIVQTDQDEVE